jgi:hypothetical protein
MTNKIVILFFLVKFILLEFKNLITLTINPIKFFNEFNFFNYLNHKFFNQKIKFRDDNINKFLEKNQKITNNEKLKIIKKNEILVELLLPHHSEPMIMNCLIGKDIQKVYNAQIVGLINKDDLLTKKIAESFGIKKFVYLNKNNLLKNLCYFIKAIKIIKLKDIDKKLFSLKFSGYEVGKAALENYLRWYNNDIFKKDKFLLYLFLSKALLALDNGEKIFKTKYKMFVIGELQFVPNKLLFHSSLKSKVPVYAAFGTSIINFIGRIYKSYSDRNSVQLKLSKKFANLLIKIFKNKKIINRIKKNKGIENIGKEIVWSNTQNIKTIKFSDKNNFCKYFNFENKKKIILILPHAMSDNLFNNEWNVFNTAYDWYLETIKSIQDRNDVNWLIKPHPYEYKFPGITARNIFNELKIKNNNIKFLDENLHINKIYSFIDLVITGNGSAGYQYSSLGIPTITTSDAKYSNFNFTLAPKNKEEYFKLLKKVNHISKIKKNDIKKAQIYWLSNLDILYNSHGLLPKIKQHGLFKKKLFFEKISKTKILRYKKDSFTDDIYYQIKNKNRHSINSFFYLKHKKKYNLKLNDI